MRMIVIVWLLICDSKAVAQHQTENLIIVTLDGFRWQEVFTGADSNLLFNDNLTQDPTFISEFWSETIEVRRSQLLPFFWNTIGAQGQLYGNRLLKNRVNCSNPHWFSYPGYSEMFTGFVDPRVRSNSKKSNPNSTIFEFINNHPTFKGEVAAFSTWDVIPFIIRADEANIPVNNFKLEESISLTDKPESAQHHRSDTTLKKTDAITFESAMQYLKEKRPKVLYISFDDTDAHGHHGDYVKYLAAAHETDQMLSMLWKWLQGDEQYREKTTLLITTDHGRGRNSWTRHGRLAPGSGDIWFAVIGPDTPARGEMRTAYTYYQKQFAKTAASFLGLDFTNRRPIGDEVHSMYFMKEITSR